MKLVLALVVGALLLVLASSRPAPPATPRAATSTPTLSRADFSAGCDEVEDSSERWRCEQDAEHTWDSYLNDLERAYEATRYAEGPYDPPPDEDEFPWR